MGGENRLRIRWGREGLQASLNLSQNAGSPPGEREEEGCPTTCGRQLVWGGVLHEEKKSRRPTILGGCVRVTHRAKK